MDKIFEFFTKKHLFANVFTIMIILLGLSTLMTIRRALWPHVDLGQMNIITAYPNASSEDVELNVTNKIEDKIKNIAGIKKYSSVSMENISSINIKLEEDLADPDDVKNEIREAVGQVTDFPSEVTDRPKIVDLKGSNFVPILEVGITGDAEYRELREQARLFEKKLKNVKGVSSVKRFGYRAREIRIEVSPGKLDNYQIPIWEIVSAIQHENVRAAGGTLESYTSEKNVVTMAKFRDPLEVGDVIVRSTFSGPQVRVKDLAVIKDDFEKESILPRISGQKAIAFQLTKTDNADVIRTITRIKKLVEEEKKYLPKDMNVHISNDTSTFVGNAFDIVVSNGLIGLALVILIITFFLNFRSAFWIGISIPTVLLGIIFLLPRFGAYLDTMTLGAMILILGIVVDDSIIISESIYSRFEAGDKPLQAAVNGLKAVIVPVITTLLTTMVVFTPMLFMPGLMGKFVFVYPLVVCLALVLSLIEIVVALPSHISHGLKPPEPGKKKNEYVQEFFNKYKDRYRDFLEGFLRFRYYTVGGAVLLLITSLWYAGNFMGFIMAPEEGAYTFYVNAELPSGSSLHATEKKVREIEKIVAEIPAHEIASFYSRSGLLFDQFYSKDGENFGTTVVILTPITERDREAQEIVDGIKEKITGIKGVEKISFSIDTKGPPVGAPVEIRVVGTNDLLRKKLADDVIDLLKKTKGVKDIERDDTIGKGEIQIKTDRKKLARVGLSAADVAQFIRVAYDGQVATSARYGDEDVDFKVAFPASVRSSMARLKEHKVPNKQGKLIRLGEVADHTVRGGMADINHIDGERSIRITADLEKGAATPLQVVALVKDNFNLDKDYPGMRFIAGGEAKESEESVKNLMALLGISIIGIYFLLVLLFNSFSQPVLVLFAIPFGITGVIIALAMHGLDFNFMVLLGVIGLSGVVVNDSLVMVDHINKLRKEHPDKSFKEIIALGSSDRLRAVLMTTITTLSGLLPLAYGIGGVDNWSGPMAMAIGWGLIFATPLTLLLVPSLCMIGDDYNSLKVWTGEKVKGALSNFRSKMV